jgi:hypothetical protein
MHFFLKLCAAVIAGLGATTIVVGLTDEFLVQHRWTYVLIGVPVLFAGLILYAKLHYRPDLVPEFLSQHCKRFFERSGICFDISLVVRDGVVVLVVMFQGRYSRSALVQIALRPLGSQQATVAPEFECGPAAFGIVSLPTPIPARYQGQHTTFEVGATVRYPQGKGKMVRFRDGVPVTYSAKFGNFPIPVEQLFKAVSRRVLLGFAALVLRAFVYLFLRGKVGEFFADAIALVTLTLPTDVAESLDETIAPSMETLWTLANGDQGRQGHGSRCAPRIAESLEPPSGDS